jgi:hypothetical protein
MPAFVPVHPPTNPDECPAWLNEAIRRLNRQAKGSVDNFAAIIRNESPDGSGEPLIDTGVFFYKPGLPNGQVAFGGSGAGENVVISSTAHTDKGFVYLGSARTTAFDEDASFFGIGTPTPDAPLHVHRAVPGLPGIGSFGNELVEITTLVAAVETELLRIVPYQTTAGPIYDAAFLATTGAAASGGLYFSAQGGVTGLRLAFGTIGADALQAAHLQAGGLSSGAAVQHHNMVLCGHNDVAGNTLRTAFNYTCFENIAASALAKTARVGFNVDPFDHSGSAAAAQPDSVFIGRRTGATATVPTVLIEGSSGSTEMALALRAVSVGTSPNRTIATNNLAGFRHDGELILANGGTTNGLMSAFQSGGSGTPAVTIRESAGSTLIFRGGKVGAWSDALAEADSPYMQWGDLNTTRAMVIGSSNFNTILRLGFSSAYTIFSNLSMAGMRAPEATPTVLTALNATTGGNNGSVVMKIESQRTGQTADMLNIISALTNTVNFTVNARNVLSSGRILSTGCRFTDDNPTITSAKTMQIDTAGIAAGNTRTWGCQNLGGNVVLVGDDPPAVAAGSLGKVDLTAQAADIATTNLTNAPPSGDYLVMVYLQCTTADATAGTLAVTIGWSDTVGATTDNTAITGFVLTATGRTSAVYRVKRASAEITYAVAVTGAYNNARYAIDVRVIALG